MNEALAAPEKQEIEQKLQTLSERALTIKVTDDATLMIADAIKSECLAMRKTVTDFFKPLKEAAHAAHKAITTAESAELAKILPGEAYVKNQMSTYQLEQKRIREAEEARLLKLAQEREEQERLERAAEIEKEAAALKAAGQTEEAQAVQQEAEQVLSTPAYVPPPKMAAPIKTKNTVKMIVDRDRLQTIADMLNKGMTKTAPTVPGVRFFQKWEYEVTNPSAVPDTYRRAS